MLSIGFDPLAVKQRRVHSKKCFITHFTLISANKTKQKKKKTHSTHSTETENPPECIYRRGIWNSNLNIDR